MDTRRLGLVLLFTATIALLGLAACASTDEPQPSPDAAFEPLAAPDLPGGDVTGASSGRARPAPRQATGPAIEVTWEALAREKYLLENSRFRRANQPMSPQKITLFSESHPNAARVAKARTKQDRDALAHSAVLKDEDMLTLVQGLRRRGFWKHARLSGYDAALAGTPNARGRVIVTQNGVSHTLLSVRGQGRNAQTKEIPAIYSEAKQAIMVMRNMTPTLNVTHYGTSGTARTR